jgi:pyruvate formate lyase activating enzyme
LPGKILLRKTSFVDYPGKISAAVFFTGCNLSCPWCHNRELITGEAENLIGLEGSLSHIKKRRKLLKGVVISGGEPCLHDELPDFIREIGKISSQDEGEPLPVKLDTNGTIPAMLEKLFSREDTRPDYIALDLKIAPRRYAELLLKSGSFAPTVSMPDPGALLSQSAELIKRAGIAHEYRTLALPEGFITEKDIEELAPLADDSPWYFSRFRGGNCLDSEWDKREESAKDAKARALNLARKAVELGKRGIVR